MTAEYFVVGLADAGEELPGESEGALGDDVALDLVRAAVDR